LDLADVIKTGFFQSDLGPSVKGGARGPWGRGLKPGKTLFESPSSYLFSDIFQMILIFSIRHNLKPIKLGIKSVMGAS
jgi:hypothetical protein